MWTGTHWNTGGVKLPGKLNPSPVAETAGLAGDGQIGAIFVESLRF